MRLVGGKEARLVHEALARARAAVRRTGAVLRPFALVEQRHGSTELHATGATDVIERLREMLHEACANGHGAMVYEAEADGDAVFVVEVFGGGRDPRTHVVPVGPIRGSRGSR